MYHGVSKYHSVSERVGKCIREYEKVSQCIILYQGVYQEVSSVSQYIKACQRIIVYQKESGSMRKCHSVSYYVKECIRKCLGCHSVPGRVKVS